jgi:hypothetical protein
MSFVRTALVRKPFVRIANRWEFNLSEKLIRACDLLMKYFYYLIKPNLT